MKNIEESAREYGYLLIAAIIIRILWTPLNSFVCSSIVPLFSEVEDNNWFIQAAITILPLLIYAPNWTKISESRKFLNHRRMVVCFLIGLYIFFRNSGKYDFYGVDKLSFSYFDSFVLVCFFIELWFALPLLCRKKAELPKVKCAQFYEERPTETDSLDRSGYISLLHDKIISSFNQGAVEEGSFTILINERYGTGKSSFMRQLKDKFLKEDITCLSIKPWSADSQEQVTSLFLSELSVAMHSHDDNALSNLISDYSDLITGTPRNVLNLLKKRITRSTSLSSQFKKITVELKKLERPLVVFIDDVDRLNYQELESVLKLVRDTADFPNIFYIVAADKKAISSTIRDSRGGDPEEYFKKFFNYEMLFPANDGHLKIYLRNRLAQILSQNSLGLLASNSTLDWFEQYNYFPIVFRNHRDIIRYLNLLSFSLDAVNANSLTEDFNMLDTARLALLEFLDADVYKLFRDYPYVLFQETSDGKLAFKKFFEPAFVDKELQHQFDDFKLHLLKTREPNSLAFDPPAEERCNNMKEVQSNALPSKDVIVASLAHELFYDAEDGDKKHIYYKSEYFKYFSGHYRKGEFSIAETRKIMTLPEGDYLETINDIVVHDALAGLIHKLSLFVKETDIPFIDILKRLVLLFDAYWHQCLQWDSSHNSTRVYSDSGVEEVMRDLLNNRSPASEEEIKAFESYFNSDTHFYYIGLVLKSIYVCNQTRAIFDPAQITKWRTNLIKRFIKDQLTPFPFKRESLWAIPALEAMYQVCWEEEFEKYVKNNECAEQWAYSLIEPSGESFTWNRNVYYNILNLGNSLPSWFLNSLKDLPPEIIEDMECLQIAGIPSNSKVEKHPYLKAAREWYKNHKLK